MPTRPSVTGDGYLNELTPRRAEARPT